MENSVFTFSLIQGLKNNNNNNSNKIGLFRATLNSLYYLPVFSQAEDQKMTELLKLVVFLGSNREGRLGSRVKTFVLDHLKAKKKYDIVVYDPIEKEFPLLKKAFHYYEKKEDAPKLLQEADADIQSADAFLLISCEYNHSIPPALSNMLDHFPASSFAWRPSAILTYSPSAFGGIRAAMQLRAMTGELGCPSVPKIFAIPKTHEVLNEAGKPVGKDNHLVKELDSLMEQLDWVATAFKNKGKESAPKL